MSKIKVMHNYRGRPSGERVIYAGEYSLDDPALFGLGGHLLKNGHAVELPVLPETSGFGFMGGDGYTVGLDLSNGDEQFSVVIEADYAQWKKADLLAAAKERGYKAEKMSKRELVELLQADDKADG